MSSKYFFDWLGIALDSVALLLGKIEQPNYQRSILCKFIGEAADRGFTELCHVCPTIGCHAGAVVKAHSIEPEAKMSRGGW